MVSILKLYFGIWRFFWRLILFICICPFSKTYRRYAIAYYRPLWKALKLVFSNLAVFIVGCLLWNFNIFLGVLFVVGFIAYQGKCQVKKIKTQKAFHISQEGFTLLELVIALSISMILTFGIIGFARGINAQRNTNKIVKEIENIYSAAVKMAKKTTSFDINEELIDDLVAGNFLSQKGSSVVGRDYSVQSDGKIVEITITLPKNLLLVKEFPQPVKYYEVWGIRWISAGYILPRAERTIADKNWYGFD